MAECRFPCAARGRMGRVSRNVTAAIGEKARLPKPRISMADEGRLTLSGGPPA